MICKIYPDNHPDIAGKKLPVRYFDIRKLTESECLRLMDVPQWGIDKLTAPDSGLSRSSLYKLAGNSIVVSCLYHIFRNIWLTEDDPDEQFTLFPEPTFRLPFPDKIRMITLCSGYDSQALAMQQLCETAREQGIPNADFDLLNWSEYDPETPNVPIESQPAVKAHNVLFPQWADRNLGDMTKIDWQAQMKRYKANGDEDVDVLFYSTPCFPAGTLVLTSKGYRPIEEIKTGDSVLSHTNTFQNVKDFGCKPYSGELYHINAMSFEGLDCTENHPFMIRRRYRYGHKAIRAFRQPEQVIAKDLTKDCYLGYAINQKSELPKWDGSIDNRWGHHIHVNKLAPIIDKYDFWYLMGRYVGDGWKRDSVCGSSIIICCSDRNEQSLTNCMDRLGLHYHAAKERTVTKYHIHMNELFNFVERYGYYAYGKRVDPETLNLPVELLKGFMDGIMDSDGCIDKVGYHKITTTSRELVYGLGQCVAKVYNRPFSLLKFIRPKKTVIEGREVNQRDTYTITWKPSKGKQDNAFYENGYIWFPINRITHEHVDNVPVYNMTVENDHTYTANGCIVHNCQSISQAGKREGMAKDSGTRSSILWYTENAIEVLHPKILIQENVSAMANATNIHDFREWQDTTKKHGYTNYWKILNAKDYGIPQNRERVFMVSVRNDLNLPTYRFPKPFRLETEVADVLDETDNPKYFLSAENVIKFLKINEDKATDGIIYQSTDHYLTKEEIEELRRNNGGND